MKHLTANEIVLVGTPTQAEAEAASEIVIGACPSYGGNKRDLADALERGEISASTIHIQGVPSYVVFWRKEMGGCFCVKGTAPIKGGIQDPERFIFACNQIAKSHNCTFGMFTSARKGEERLFSRYGAKPVAVVYTLKAF